MSGWIGFSTAVSGLLTSQKSLYITNHNIVNVDSEGYSRQKGVQHALSPHYLAGTGLLGGGTTIDSIRRVRDDFVDFKYWTEQGNHGQWEIKQKSLYDIENIFNEPSDNSLNKNLEELYTALDILSTNPSDSSNRRQLKEVAVALTKNLNEVSSKLYNSQKELNFSVMTNIKQVNDYAVQISNLNKEIGYLEMDGTMANDLRDKRDLVMDQLSKLVNVNAKEIDGKYTVTIKGVTLVEHDMVSKFKYPPALMDNPWNPKEKLAKVQWESSGETVNLESGEIKSLLELRDGDGEGNTYRGVPFYIKRLNQYAQKMVERFNEIHYQGKGLEGESDIFFFTIDNKTSNEFYSGMDYSDAAKVADMNQYIKDNVRADNISLSMDIQADLNNICAGSKDNEGVEDKETILKLIETRDDRHFFDSNDAPKGKPEDFIQSIISTLSVDSQQSIRMEGNQATILKSIVKRRTSISGVSMDEETANLVKYQHSYTASAKMITTMDKIYDITINRLGLVGR